MIVECAGQSCCLLQKKRHTREYLTPHESRVDAVRPDGEEMVLISGPRRRLGGAGDIERALTHGKDATVEWDQARHRGPRMCAAVGSAPTWLDARSLCSVCCRAWQSQSLTSLVAALVTEGLEFGL